MLLVSPPNFLTLSNASLIAGASLLKARFYICHSVVYCLVIVFLRNNMNYLFYFLQENCAFKLSAKCIFGLSSEPKWAIFKASSLLPASQ